MKKIITINIQGKAAINVPKDIILPRYGDRLYIANKEAQEKSCDNRVYVVKHVIHFIHDKYEFVEVHVDELSATNSLYELLSGVTKNVVTIE